MMNYDHEPNNCKACAGAPLRVPIPEMHSGFEMRYVHFCTQASSQYELPILTSILTGTCLQAIVLAP